MTTSSNVDTKECRLCHRIGLKAFVPAGSEEWECSNDRACQRRVRVRNQLPCVNLPGSDGDAR